MFSFLMIIHMFSIMGGGASGIGNGILMARVARAGAPPPDYVRATMKTLGRIGLASIILLWLSGISMVLIGGVAFTTYFAVKLIGAAAVLGAILTLTAHTAKAQKEGHPPDLALMKKIARVAQVGVVIAIIFAVLAFG